MSSENLPDAKRECNENPACGYIMDTCGENNEFYYCVPGTALDSSGCGSITYAKPVNNIQGKISAPS